MSNNRDALTFQRDRDNARTFLSRERKKEEFKKGKEKWIPCVSSAFQNDEGEGGGGYEFRISVKFSFFFFFTSLFRLEKIRFDSIANEKRNALEREREKACIHTRYTQREREDG